MKTVSATKEEAHASRRWFVVDAENLVLGRVSTRIASILRGKHKPSYTPHVDTGDFVVVVNAHKVRLTGRKEERKLYHKHTGWVGGVVTQTAAQLREKHPEDMITKAVRGMLPKGPLGRAMLKKLKVYAAAEHPHAAQNPEPMPVY